MAEHEALKFPSTAPELIETWYVLSKEERRLAFSKLPLDESEDFFLSISAGDRAEILTDLPIKERRLWLKMLPPDDAADVIQEVSEEDKQGLLALLDERSRFEVSAILQYHEDTAGGLMTPEYLRLRPHMTIEEALGYVRLQIRNRVELVRYAYVLSDERKLLGVVSLRTLLSMPPSLPLASVIKDDPVFVTDTMTSEEVANFFSKYRFDGIPVLDADSVMKGIVTVDDIVDVIREEATKDFQMLGASEELDEPYMQIGFFKMIRKRAGWLCILFVGEMFTATAMTYFEKEIEKAVVLALFIPLIISSGGNSGSQASTLIVRSLALGEVRLRDWWRVLFRELSAGAVLGIILGTMGLVRILAWPTSATVYGEHYILVAATVSTSLLGIVTWGTISGSMLPFILRYLKFDPATASAPFVATLVDVTGLVIYFTLASIILKGTLL